MNVEIDEVEQAREKCRVCGLSYNPSLIESRRCIFCIAKQFKQALRKIRDLDYRGNKHESHYIAEEALK